MTMATEPATRFHLSLNVSNLGRSVDFYRILLGTEPAKRHDDYAKFDLDEPPLVLSLVPRAPGQGGSLSHVGLRVTDNAAIRAVEQRLEAAGIRTSCQEGTVCGYARQNKIWVADPDQTFWEVYVVEEDVGPPSTAERGMQSADLPAAPAGGEANNPQAAAPTPDAEAVWEHFVTQPIPDRIPHADGSLAEVRLTGTLNARLTDDQINMLIQESWRVLRPGGKILTHGLMGDRPFPPGPPSLPGLAALVQRVPEQTEPVRRFRDAGFVSVQYVKLTEEPWFRRDGVELREVKVIGFKPTALEAPTRQVVYRRPFRQAVDDLGNCYPRGRRVPVSAATWELLRQGAAAEQFLFVNPGPAACGLAPERSNEPCPQP